MKNELDLDILSDIRKVKASPFLYTRITAKLEAQRKNNSSPRQTSLVVITACLLIILNASLLLYSGRHFDDKAEKSLLLFDTNQTHRLYYE
jgi:hypothetical protein